MKTIFVLTAFIAVCVAGIWVWKSPNWDSYTGLTVAVVTFIGTTLVPSKKVSSVKMSQRVGDRSIAIQSGNNTHIGTATSEKKDADV